MRRDEMRDTLIEELQAQLVDMDLDEIAEAIADALWPHQFKEIAKLVEAAYGKQV